MRTSTSSGETILRDHDSSHRGLAGAAAPASEAAPFLFLASFDLKMLERKEGILPISIGCGRTALARQQGMNRNAGTDNR